MRPWVANHGSEAEAIGLIVALEHFVKLDHPAQAER